MHQKQDSRQSRVPGFNSYHCWALSINLNKPQHSKIVWNYFIVAIIHNLMKAFTSQLGSTNGLVEHTYIFRRSCWIFVEIATQKSRSAIFWYGSVHNDHYRFDCVFKMLLLGCLYCSSCFKVVIDFVAVNSRGTENAKWDSIVPF